MSLHNTDIQGNANISRNANVGGHANINGDVLVGHNMVIKGWLDAPNIKGTCKGLYASEAALKAAYPRPMPGWFALVGNTLPAQVWRVDGGVWTPTGETGGQFNLWLDQLETDVKDLTDDVRDLEELLDNGLLLGKTIEFTSTGTAATMKFTIMKSDGSTKEESKPIPIVTAEKAGMMSAADKKELSVATAAIKTLNEKIADLETKTADLKKALDKEIADREAADTTLSGRITDEATARRKADEELQGKLKSETAERKEADMALQDYIDQSAEDISGSVAQEALTRQKADDALQVLIDNLRKDFDALVGENASEAIDNFTEVLAFLEGVKDTETLAGKLMELQQGIESEADERKDADADLGTRIESEADERKERDADLQAKIAQIKERLAELDGYRLMEDENFIFAIMDKDEDYLLFGIDRTGRVVFDKGIPGEVQQRFDELKGYQVMHDENYLFAITDSIGTLLFGIETTGQIIMPQGQVQMKTREEYEAIEPQPDVLYVIKGHNGMTEGAYINGQTLNAGEACNFVREENIIKYRGSMKSIPIIHIDHETMEAKIDYPSDYEGPMFVSDPETKTLFVM